MFFYLREIFTKYSTDYIVNTQINAVIGSKFTTTFIWNIFG